MNAIRKLGALVVMCLFLVSPALADDYIENRATGKVLDVPEGKACDGLGIIQWAKNGGTNQQWELAPLRNGWYYIENRATGKVLDVPEGKACDGLGIIQWVKNGGTNQQWELVPLGNGWCYIENRATGKSLDVPEGYGCARR